jgi:uncharacterized membrane protein YoaK (UPF0700 family)
MQFKPLSSPLPALLLILSGVTGLVDAVSVLGLGKVFTANMTGNVVFLGFAIVGTPGFSPLPLLLALGGFLAGSVVAGNLGKRAAAGPLRRWLMTAAVLEAALLLIAAMCADGPARGAGHGLFLIIVLTAAAMGLRNATIRQLKVPDLTTTVLTLTLAGLAADSRLAGGRNPNMVRRILAVLAVLAGAALGAALVNRFGLALPLVLAGLTTFGATALTSLHASTAKPHTFD